MKRKFKALATALCCCIALTSTSHARHSYRLLKLDGYEVRWPLPTHGPLTLTYKIVNNTFTATPNSRTCGAGLTSFDGLVAKSNLTIDMVKVAAKDAFYLWESVANVKFVETDSDNPNILLGAQTEYEGWAFADVYFDVHAVGNVKPITKGLVCVNPTQTWKVGFGGNDKTYDLVYTFAHEIGHVLGLDHPEDSANQLMGFKYHERFRSPQVGDSLAASSLYGKPATVMAGK